MSTINCKRCGEREDELCIFFNCASSRRMWNEAPISQQISTGLYKNFHSFLPKALLVSGLPPSGLVSTPTAPCLLWNLWKARNCLIFDDRHFTEKDIINKATREARDWQSAQVDPPKQQAKSGRAVV
ncbi:hypothetical protein ISN45_Aa01g028280, partial [Arabidopsis thaliana x Arabidopsis arenosa]